MKKQFKKLDTGESIDIHGYLIDEWKDIEYSDVNSSILGKHTELEKDASPKPKHSSNTAIKPGFAVGNTVKKIVYDPPPKPEKPRKDVPLPKPETKPRKEVPLPKKKQKKKKCIPKSLLQSYLNDVAEDQHFILNDGNALKNLKQLSTALLTIAPEVYNHHVTPERNDFYNWVSGVIGDKTAANSIHRSKTRYEMAQRISTRVQFLEKQTR